MIYEVQARVVRRVGDLVEVRGATSVEATVSYGLPTFLIDGDIQGIVHDANAAQRVERVARNIINPVDDPNVMVHVIVIPRDLPRTTDKDAHEVVIPNLGTLSLPDLNLDGALELAAAFACADELTWVEDEEGFCADHGPLVFVVDTPDGDPNGPCVWDVGLLNYEGSGSMMGSAASVEAAKAAALAAGRKYLADALKRLILTGSFDGELAAPEPVPAPKAGFLSKLVETLTRK